MLKGVNRWRPRIFLRYLEWKVTSGFSVSHAGGSGSAFERSERHLLHAYEAEVHV